MSTMTEDRDESMPITPPAHLGDLVTMPRCKRCNLAYMPTKSSSALRLTYCSFLCELGDLGFSMVGLEHMERVKKDAEAEPEAGPEPVAAE